MTTKVVLVRRGISQFIANRAAGPELNEIATKSGLIV